MLPTNELTRRHAVSLAQVNDYRAIAPALAEEACKLRDHGFAHWRILEALKSSEATTAFGLAWWIAAVLEGMEPALIERMPWYQRLKDDDA